MLSPDMTWKSIRMASESSQDVQRLEQPELGQLAMYEAGEGTRTRHVPDTGHLPLGADSSLFRLLFQKEEWGLCPGPGSTHALPLTQLLPVKSPIIPSPSPEAGVLDSHLESSGPALGNCQELQLPNSLILTHTSQQQTKPASGTR